MHPNFKKILLEATNTSSCEEIEMIQSLWSGYGKISRYELEGKPSKRVVVKHITLQKVAKHPRDWNTDLSHQRKIKSYAVETLWYEQWNQYCTKACRTPQLVTSYAEGDEQWIVLEDLDAYFPSRKNEVNFPEIKACLQWLASFHAQFLNQKPKGLWEIGTYWHLDTRPDEWEEMAHKELQAKASQIDTLLNACQFKTIVHGDAKLANFCFSSDGLQVAAVDFQYVGGGCGMKDVAYFLGSCLSSDDLVLHEKELLDFYFNSLKEACVLMLNESSFFGALEEEWRKMYPLACADFTRFLLGWMPKHQKINKYNLDLMESVLNSL